MIAYLSVIGKQFRAAPLQQPSSAVRRHILSQEEKALITHSLRLVSHIARKYTVPDYGPDDLISICVIGLIKAVNSFKPPSGTALGTYAARCIERAIPSPPRQTG